MTALYNAAKGNMKSGFSFAGSNAFKASKISSVNEVFTELIDGFKQKRDEMEGRIKEAIGSKASVGLGR
jgi:hypothetical protein